MSIKIDSIVECKITAISSFGAFVEIDKDNKGMIHISELSHSYVDDITKVLKVGDVVKAKVVSISDDAKISLSIKAIENEENIKLTKGTENKKKEKAPQISSPGDYQWENVEKSDASFEDMMSKFKRTSEDKMSDLKKNENRGYSRRGRGR